MWFNDNTAYKKSGGNKLPCRKYSDPIKTLRSLEKSSDEKI
jgi:hypothetical protein